MCVETIRPLGSEEARECAQLWQRTQRSAYTWMRPEQMHPLEDALAYFESEIRVRCAIWVAAREGVAPESSSILGFIALEPERAWIDQLYVDPEHQGRGIGSRLLAHARAVCPQGLDLVTLQRNTRARRFYESRGFLAVGCGLSPAPECEPDVQYAWRPGAAAPAGGPSRP